MDKDSIFEISFIIISVSLIVAFNFSGLYEHKLTHKYATGPYLASDAYQDLRYAQEVYNNGDFKYVKMYSELPKAVGDYMPGLFMFPAMISRLSGIEVHDALAIWMTLVFLMILLSTYLIIRHYSKKWAILSVPCISLIFISPFNIPLLWGQWGLSLGILWLLIGVWICFNLEADYFFIFFAFIISALVITHPSELLFFGLICTAIIVWKLFADKSLGWKNLWIKSIISLVIVLAFSSYYFIIFSESFKASVYGNFINLKPMLSDGFPQRNFLAFGLFIPFFLLGLILLFIKRKKEQIFVALPFFILLIITFFNLLGGELAFRALMLRFFWPIIFSIFFSVGLYFALQLLRLKKFHIFFSLGILLLSLLFMGNIGKVGINKAVPDAVMDGLQSIKANTAEGSRILVFPSRILPPNHIGFQAYRNLYYLNPESYAKAISANDTSLGKLDTRLNIVLSAAYQKGFMQIGSYSNDRNLKIDKLCEVDYIFIDKYPANGEIAEFNKNFVDNFINSKKGTLSYDGEWFVLLKTSEEEKCKKSII